MDFETLFSCDDILHFIPSLRSVEINLLVTRTFPIYRFLYFCAAWNKMIDLWISSHWTSLWFDAQRSRFWNDHHQHQHYSLYKNTSPDLKQTEKKQYDQQISQKSPIITWNISIRFHIKQYQYPNSIWAPLSHSLVRKKIHGKLDFTATAL